MKKKNSEGGSKGEMRRRQRDDVFLQRWQCTSKPDVSNLLGERGRRGREGARKREVGGDVTFHLATLLPPLMPPFFLTVESCHYVCAV